jgi:hypothetical protein
VAKLLQTNLPFATGPNVSADTFNQLVRTLEINLGSIDPDNTLQLTTAERDELNFNIGQIIYNTTTTTLQYWDGTAFQNISAIGAVNLNVSDGSSTIGININTQTLSLIGGTGITSNASGTSVTFAIDSSVVTLTGTQTLTNKTLTSPTLTSPVLNGTLSGSAFLDEDNMASNSATAVASQQSIKAYVDSQVGTVDTLAEILANGNTTGGTDIAVSANDDITFTDSSKALFGASSDLQIYHDGTHSYIEETNGTGNLYIRGESIDLRRQANGEQYILAQPNGAVTLFYDGSSKLATTNTGIDVTGITVTDGITSSAAYKSSGGNTGGSGQLINVGGDAVNQTNSGTIRLTEKTYDVSPYYQGAYIKYDGSLNHFKIGTHNASTNALSDDTDHMVLARGTQTVDFKGTIQVGGTNVILSSREIRNVTALKMNDNNKILLGTSQDFEIFHNATNNILNGVNGDIVFQLAGSEKGRFLSTGFSVVGNVAITGNFNTSLGGYQIAGTTIIDSSKNASNLESISMADNKKIYLGASNDLEIYHDSNNSYINEVGTGDLIIKGGNDILFQDAVGNTLANMNQSNSVELYFGGSKKFETSSAGITITGTITSGAITSSGLVTADELSVTNDATFNGSVDATGQDVVAATYNINNIAINGSSTATTSATTQVAVDSVSKTTFRTVKYLVQITNSTDSTYHATEILVTHDGTTPSITEYATIFTGSAEEATFSADISGSNLRLLATPASTDSMTFKITRTGIKV